MKNIFLRRISFLTLSFLLATCKPEYSVENGLTLNSGVVDDNLKVTAGISGIVIDENGQPVSGALVTSGTASTQTDRYGVFHFGNISISKANGYVKVNKTGYFTGMRSFPTTAGMVHNVRIRLIPKIDNGTIASATGGSITLPSGAKLTLPADAVTDQNGVAYTGAIKVSMAWIDPASVLLPENVVGDLRGITATGAERGLETFGMIGVELKGTTGQSLKIASGKKATLDFPIPPSLLANAPATIDLWHFDETRGRWLQEGTASRSGSSYTALVSHFSFWNCDAQFPLVNLCMKLVNAADSAPLNNVAIRLKRPNGSYGYGRTDSIGRLCGKVPLNEALVLEVIDQCNTVVATRNIGPFSSDTDLGIITATMPASQVLTIAGTIKDCSNNAVTNGAVSIYADGSHYYNVPLTNGNFTLEILRCSSTPITFSVTGVDYNTLQSSLPVSYTANSGTFPVGNIQACGTTASEFIEMIIDGTPYNYVKPPDNIAIMDSVATGAYTSNTLVYGTRSSSTNTSGAVSYYSSFSFANNGTPANGLPLNSLAVSMGGNSYSNTIVTPSPTMNLTAFGSVGSGYAEGNFSVQMNFGGTIRNVICNFKVRR